MSDETIHPNDAPLTPEERALAQRLARTAPRGEPSPTLDARILAAAHAAASAPVDAGAGHARRPRAKRQRWPALLGYAATAAIACGIAWQLRPLPAPPVATAARVHAEEPLADYASPPPMQGRVVPHKPLQVPEPPPAEAAPQRERGAAVRPATRADAERKPPSSETLPPFVIDEAVHPGANAAAASGNIAAKAAAAPAAAAAVPAAPPPPAAQAMQRDAAGVDAMEASGEPESAEADEEVVPPATADSPAVREAWLQRIRELLKNGQGEAARDSLREFRHRYPQQVLPDDLRALEK